MTSGGRKTRIRKKLPCGRGIETSSEAAGGGRGGGTARKPKDRRGNAGTIGAGDVQWMTSGGGILHEEMPKPKDGEMEGFQLWVNLPARLKMSRPRYREIKADRIPEVRRPGGGGAARGCGVLPGRRTVFAVR